MYHYYEFNQSWFMQQYHKRSNVETTFHMIKSKFGDSLRSKTKTAQINEALVQGALPQYLLSDSVDV